MGKFKYVDGQLAGHDYLMGKQFTVADGYLFTMLSWADRMKFDLSGLSNLMAYKARVGARPKVQEALDQGRPDEGGVRVSLIANERKGRIDDPALFFFVIASEAKQPFHRAKKNGLLRRKGSSQ